MPHRSRHCGEAYHGMDAGSIEQCYSARSVNIGLRHPSPQIASRGSAAYHCTYMGIITWE